MLLLSLANLPRGFREKWAPREISKNEKSLPRYSYNQKVWQISTWSGHFWSR